MKKIKCIVKGCLNHKSEGRFVGDLCAPCHKYLSTGQIGPTASFLSELGNNLNWKPMYTAPYDTPVILCGDSGMMPPNHIFIINGFKRAEWHDGDWNDMQGTRLEDTGWKPLFWASTPNLPSMEEIL